MNKIKEKILHFMWGHYNPNKTTLELGDLISFFGITPKDVLDYYCKYQKEKSDALRGKR